MNVNVEKYNAQNGAQILNANELLEQIFKDGVEDIKIILDIGCGSGNVTKIVSETIPHEKIYSFDIDPDMVEHSKKLNENNPKKIEFFVQDIAVPWEALNQTLRDLEGKVDLVWSNRVLHWIPEDLRSRAAQNIVRLLRQGGGRLYINTTLTINPLHPSLTPEVRAEYEKVMKVPSKDTQHEWWRQYFSQAGLSSLSVDFYAKEFDSGSNENFRWYSDFFHFWKRYIPADIPVEQHDEIIEKLSHDFLLTCGHPIGQATPNPLETLTRWYYGQFRIIGVK